MEARAKHDFNKTAEDELAFKKNDVLKVLNQTDDANWYKAELNGKQGYIPKNYIEMTNPEWYLHKGRLTRAEAEKLLLEKKHGHFVQPDGGFLVRNSESNPGDFSLSVKYGSTVQHFKIMNDLAGKYFVWVVKHTSINELVKYHRENSVSRDRKILLKDMVASTPAQPIHPVLMYVKALYDFEPQDNTELRFCKGQVIGVTDNSDINWWTGELNGEVGQFPKTYVEVMNS